VKRKISNWTAEAFVFSGRPNPEWVLTDKQAVDWMNLWQTAPYASKEVQLPSRLGYTGCRLQMNEHSYWILSDGCVSFYDNKQVIPKKDAENKMELFLLNSASEEPRQILLTLGLI
jgi:hypothetical protein